MLTFLIPLAIYIAFVLYRFESSWLEGKGKTLGYWDRFQNGLALPGYLFCLFGGALAIAAFNRASDFYARHKK